jgi:hypothetical protein
MLTGPRVPVVVQEVGAVQEVIGGRRPGRRGRAGRLLSGRVTERAGH